MNETALRAVAGEGYGSCSMGGTLSVSWAQFSLVGGVTALWAVSFGIGTQATSHWLKSRDASDTLVGFVHASYYLGVAVASILAPRMTRRFGLGTASLGMALSAATLAIFPLAGGAIGWLSLRFFSGAGCALSLVPLEAYLSRNSPEERRTEIFSYYAVALTLAGAAGIALGLEWFDEDGLLIGWLGAPVHGFWIGALFPLIGSMITQHTLARIPWDDEPPTANAIVELRPHVLSFGTAWAQGFLEGGMLAFLSLELVRRGVPTSTVGGLMGLAMVGVIAFQVPVGWLADRLGRRRVLLGCYAVTILGLILIPNVASAGMMGLLLFLVGACSGAMYPLGLSLLGEAMPAQSLARAYALYLAMECVGSQMGAAILGAARDFWGGDALFHISTLALIAVLGLWSISRHSRAIPSAEKSVDDAPRRAA